MSAPAFFSVSHTAVGIVVALYEIDPVGSKRDNHVNFFDIDVDTR